VVFPCIASDPLFNEFEIFHGSCVFLGEKLPLEGVATSSEASSLSPHQSSCYLSVAITLVSRPSERTGFAGRQ
jgi:hypothetical protein